MKKPPLLPNSYNNMFENELKDMVKKGMSAEDEREKKRKLELEFEDQSWICIGSGFTFGLIGLFMYFKYNNSGYKKKASQVCVLSIISFVGLILLTVLMQIGKSNRGYN